MTYPLNGNCWSGMRSNGSYVMLTEGDLMIEVLKQPGVVAVSVERNEMARSHTINVKVQKLADCGAIERFIRGIVPAFAEVDVKFHPYEPEKVSTGQSPYGKRQELIRRAICEANAGKGVAYLTVPRHARHVFQDIREISLQDNAGLTGFPQQRMFNAKSGPGYIEIVGDLHAAGEIDRLRGVDCAVISDPFRDQALADRCKVGDWCKFDAATSTTGMKAWKWGRVVENYGPRTTVRTGPLPYDEWSVPTCEIEVVPVQDVPKEIIGEILGEGHWRTYATPESAKVTKEMLDAATTGSALANLQRALSERVEKEWRDHVMAMAAMSMPPAIDHVPSMPSVDRRCPGDSLVPKSEPFQSRLARVFGLAPDAPDEVLLSTAEKAWAGESRKAAAAEALAKKANRALDIERQNNASLRDQCGILQTTNKALEKHLSEALLKLKIRK
jgi:hypothetical protein